MGNFLVLFASLRFRLPRTPIVIPRESPSVITVAAVTMKEIRNRSLYSGNMILKRKFKRVIYIYIHFCFDFYFVRCSCFELFFLVAQTFSFFTCMMTMSGRLRVSVSVSVGGCTMYVQMSHLFDYIHKSRSLNHRSQYNLFVHTALNIHFHYSKILVLCNRQKET